MPIIVYKVFNIYGFEIISKKNFFLFKENGFEIVSKYNIFLVQIKSKI